MRKREEILEDRNMGKYINEVLILETLLDIRDILTTKEK